MKKSYTYNVRFVNNKGITTKAFILDYETKTLHIFNEKTYPKHAKWKNLSKYVVEHLIKEIKDSECTKGVIEHL